MSPLQIARLAHENREVDARACRFPVPTRMTAIERDLARHTAANSQIFKTLMKPENADQIIDAIPSTQDTALHVLLCGDFVFFDLVSRLVSRLGSPVAMTITTLSLSLKNLVALEDLLNRFGGFQIDLVISSYFESTSKDIFCALEHLASKFAARLVITIGRSHAKIILLDYGPDAGVYVMETSSNLRSSNCLEQLSIFQERALYDFHATWIREFIAAQAAKK